MTTILGVPWPVWAALIALVTSTLTLAINSKLSERQLRREAARTVAGYRVEWIERLRRESAVFISEAFVAYENPDVGIWGNSKIHEAANYVLMMLNPVEHKELHSALMDSFSKKQSGQIDAEKVVELRELTQGVLKQEWEVSKQEILGRSKALDDALKIQSMRFRLFGLDIHLARDKQK